MSVLLYEQNLVKNAVADKYGGHVSMQLHKIDPQRNEAVWYAKISCLKANDEQVLAVVTPIDAEASLGTERLLRNLPWRSIHTRLSKDTNLMSSLNEQQCPVKVEVSDLARQVLKSPIHVTRKSQFEWTYVCEKFPSLLIYILLNHDDEELRETGDLMAALDTWRAIVVFQL